MIASWLITVTIAFSAAAGDAEQPSPFGKGHHGSWGQRISGGNNTSEGAETQRSSVLLSEQFEAPLEEVSSLYGDATDSPVLERPSEWGNAADYCFEVGRYSCGPLALQPMLLPRPKVTVSVPRGCGASTANEVVSIEAAAPELWRSLPWGKPLFEIEFIGPRPATPKGLQVYFDGSTIESLNGHWSASGPFLVDQTVQYRYAMSFDLPQPAPGRHIIQARVLYDDLWSEVSAPIYFEMLPLRAPRIVGLVEGCDANRAPALWTDEPGRVVVTNDEVSLLLADVEDGAAVAVFLNGERVCEATPCIACGRYHVPLNELVPTGEHSLAVRAACSADGLLGEASAEVLVEFRPSRVRGFRMLPPRKRNVSTKQKVEPKCAKAGIYKEEKPVAVLTSAVATLAVSPEASESTAPGEVATQVAKAGGASNGAKGPAMTPSPPASTAEKTGTDVERKEFAFTRKVAEARVYPQGDQPDHDKSNPTGNPQVDIDPLSRDDFEFRFFDAASFPLREFGLRGETIRRDGAVIYEGMKFTVNHEGFYDVAFLAEIPPMTTVLHLQLLVHAEHRHCRCVVNGEPCRCERENRGLLDQRQAAEGWFTITLPPIRLEPDAFLVDNAAGDTHDGVIYRVRHTGYSAALDMSGKGHGVRILEVRRKGTARFGFDSTTY